ncbi:MAG TPA: FAD-dependent oxidoreductase [Xanthobacteraceae bacterium]|jgi:3-phenylpropionate/trans-cinnamate dioxygenase ferredoxin reductase subunit|nr:FAD-dependent oxidoreductase [Xanthobacteraceae bacterium]
MSGPVLVIGAGQAAAQLAMSLRQGGFAERIVVIGEEPYLPYQRPPLSKKFLSERREPDVLLLRSEKFWRDQNVAFELGTAVAAVDPARRRVTLTDGREIDFGTLVFATGTSARMPPIPGLAQAGVHVVRRIDDVARLRPALDDARRVVIIGGGYIGLEVAAVVRGEGRDVLVLEALDRVLTRVTGPPISEFYTAYHRERGVDVRLGAKILGIERGGRGAIVRLEPDERIAADLVLVATGARANDEIARAAGIACEDGVLVDEQARTSAPGIYAIGDCTRFPSRRYGRHLRLESVQNAIDQAKAAAASILGAPQPYDPVPWFWSDQYDLKLQMAGLSHGCDDVAIVGDVSAKRFSVEYRRAGRLIAVDAVNDARAHMLSRRRIAEETG